MHAINELESSHLITSNELLPKLKKLQPQLTHLKKVFFVPDVVGNAVETCSVPSLDQVDLVSYNDLLRIGSALQVILTSTLSQVIWQSSCIRQDRRGSRKESC